MIILVFQLIGGNGLSNVASQILQHVVLDMPGLAFFTTYALLVLFWAEIYYQVVDRLAFHSFFLVFPHCRCIC